MGSHAQKMLMKCPSRQKGGLTRVRILDQMSDLGSLLASCYVCSAKVSTARYLLSPARQALMAWRADTGGEEKRNRDGP